MSPARPPRCLSRSATPSPPAWSRAWRDPAAISTGFTNFEPSIASKWLELVKRVTPNITRVAYLFNPDTAPLFYARAVETAAPMLSVKPFAAAVHNADEMERVIEQFARESDGALLVLPDLFTATNRQSI